MALEGSLQDMSLVDLFQVFRMGPKSGMLILQHEDKRGVIYVHEGRLLDAFVVQGVARTVIATRDEAVLSLLAWHEACFVFRHDLSVVGRPTRIEHDAEWLVLESMRRSTRTPVASTYQNLTIETRLQLSPLPNSAESSVSLDVDQWRILSHAANNEDLQTICAATNIDKERTFRIVNELLAIGLVEIAPLASVVLRVRQLHHQRCLWQPLPSRLQ
ncbi:MAG: DUF4388 domain-containing protein [Chloroflexaceae bacterium]|nr:DUF4388 domain-containing protein [Chloroflexaceae bacterium]